MSTTGSDWISPAPAPVAATAGRLPYDHQNQYSPFNPNGQRKYSNSFMNALRDFMELDDDYDDDLAARGPAPEKPAELHNEISASGQPAGEVVRLAVSSSSLPYEPNQYSPTNPDGKRKYSQQFLKAVYQSMVPGSDVELGGEEREGARQVVNASDIQYDDDQQYRPTKKTGHRKYSCRFLKAIGSAMVQEREDLSLLLTRSLFPWDLGGYNKNVMKRHSIDRTSSTSEQATASSFMSSEPTPQELLADLKTVENPWRPELADEKERDITCGKLTSDRLVKMFRGYLNKLTPNNCVNIIHQITILPLDATDAVNLANLVFEKALDEPKYCQLYARLCSQVLAIQELVATKCIHLLNRADPYEDLNLDARREDMAHEVRPSRRLLLAESLYELMRQRRAKHLGAIKLVGELYKLAVLKLDVILKYIVKFTDDATNESIEFVCGLMASVGAQLASNPVLSEFLEQLMTTLRHYSSRDAIGVRLDARVRFKVLDTLEMSESNWQARLGEEEPKTLEEIRREFAKSTHSTSSTRSGAYFKSGMDDTLELLRMLDM